MDINKLKEDLSGIFGNNLANIIVIIIAIFAAIGIYQADTRNIAVMQDKLNSGRQKNELLLRLDSLNKNIKALKSPLTGRDISLTIPSIKDIAQNSAVRIISLKPQAERDFPLYVKYVFELVVAADDFHSMGRFMADIENSPDFYFVEQLSMSIPDKSSSEDQKRELVANLYIVRVELKKQILEN